VKFFWKVVHGHRPRLGSVLDVGAGDGRFARYGCYESYTGVEIDATRISDRHPRKNARVIQGCVFSRRKRAFDACIGNPPYLRHQDIESPWKETTLSRLSSEIGVVLSGHGNLFLYFMALALLQTSASGIAALIVPFDWVSRPAASGIRKAIRDSRWNVSVYRFSFPVFDGVDTTASISIIDKKHADGRWRYYDVGDDLQPVDRRGVTGSGRALLSYAKRANHSTREGLFARRGLSPGSQQVFTLTEGERIHHGLSRHDVVPCVTTLRGVTTELELLDRDAFQRLFVSAGRRCWLIRSREPLSHPLRRYLEAVPPGERATATCRNQEPWYNYEAVAVPDLLIHSGFTGNGPRVVINSVGAIPVGSMYGLYGCPKGHEARVRGGIMAQHIFGRVVPHSRRLRKIEVGQLNGLLEDLGTGHG